MTTQKRKLDELDADDEKRVARLKLDANSADVLEPVPRIFLLVLQDAMDLPDELLKLILAYACIRCDKCAVLFFFPMPTSLHVRLNCCASHPGEILCASCILCNCRRCGRGFCTPPGEATTTCLCSRFGVSRRCGHCETKIEPTQDELYTCRVTTGELHAACTRCCRICEMEYCPAFFFPDDAAKPTVGVCVACRLLGFTNSWQGPRTGSGKLE